MPSLRVLIYYARVAGIPLEFIVDDDIDLDHFKHYLTVVEQRRDELTDPEPEHHIALFWAHVLSLLFANGETRNA
jgi:hypothetical protein